MLDISDETKEYYAADSAKKEIRIKFPNGEINTITNANVVSESMQLTEILCDEDQLYFGACNSAKFTCMIAELNASIVGMKIQPYIYANGEELPLGVFTITGVTKQKDKAYKSIEAYDAIYDINTDVTDWYNGLWGSSDSITLKEYRDSFFNYIGIEQAETELPLDSITVSNTYVSSDESINGITILKAICEINGCFGVMNRYGQFEYRKLKSQALYPAESLYPAEDLYPSDGSADTVDLADSGITIKETPSYSEYVTVGIDGVRIIDDNGVQYITENAENPYTISNNYLLSGKTASELEEISATIKGIISGAGYRPCEELKIQGTPYLEVGDAVTFRSQSDIVNTYILKRTLSGIQSLTDVYEAKGSEYMTYDANSVTGQLKAINQSTNTLSIRQTATEDGLVAEVSRATAAEGTLQSSITQNAESIKSEVTRATAAEGTLQSSITQNAESITTKVSSDSIISTINQSAEAVTINASKININGVISANNNFTVGTDGKITATGATISGDVIGTTLKANQAIYINSAADSTYIQFLNCLSGSWEWTTMDVGSTYASSTSLITANSLFQIPNEGKMLRIYPPTRIEDLNCAYSFHNKLAADAGRIETFYAGVANVNSVEISHSTPFIDFHFGRSTSDYTSRLIEAVSGSIYLRINSSSSVGWFHAAGYSVDSSRQVKTNIASMTDSEALKLLELEPVSFDYKTGETDQRGLIAEDVAKVLPNCVQIPDGYDEDTFVYEEGGENIVPSIDYSKFVPYLIKLAQIQQKEINELKEVNRSE